MSKRVILSMGLATTAVLVVLVVQTRPDRRAAKPVAEAGRAAVGDAITAPPVRPVTRLVAAQTSARAEAAPPAVEPELDEVQYEAQAAHALDRAFDAEVVEASWAADTQAAVRRAFAGFPGGTPGRVECRSTMCRVDVSFADADTEEKVFEILPRTPPFDSHGFIHRAGTDGGARQVTIYIARAGHRLPGR